MCQWIIRKITYRSVSYTHLDVYKRQFEYIAKTEGIICAIESAHAIAHAIKIAPTMKKDDILIVCLSGRGDKDVAAIARYRGKEIYE